MLEQEIELVDSGGSSGGVWSHKREAWYKIKDDLTKLQNISSNSDYAKCIECDEQKQRNPHYSYCPNCGMHFA